MSAPVLQTIPKQEHTGESRVVRKFVEEKPFEIRRENNAFVVSGKRIENLLIMSNLDQEESLQRFQRICIKMGVEDELRRMGIKEGDIVRIMELEFEFSE